MKKYNNFSRSLLIALMIALAFSSCKKEYITEAPKAVSDKGERLVLNDNLVILENSKMSHGGGQQGILFDESTGVVRFDEASELGVVFELDTNTVVNIDMGDDVIVRKVTQVETSGGEYVLQTTQGGINDIFDKAKIGFDFSPEYSNQQLKTKSISGLQGEELSKALTDENGRIHPTRIRLVDGDREVTIFSVKDNIPLKSANSVARQDGKVGFEHQINPQLYIPKLPVTVGIEDFGFSVWTNLKADYHISKHYYTKHTWLGTVKIYDGETGTFSVTAEDTDISGWIDIGVEARGDVPLIDEDVPLFDPKELMFDIQVGPVPVVIGIEIELLLELNFKLGGELKLVSGMEFTYNIPKVEFGAWQNAAASSTSTGTHHDIKLSKEIKIEPRPLRIEAMAKLTQNYSIRPSFGFSIYRTAGPEIAFPVHAEYVIEMGAGESFSLADTTEAPKAYVGWGANLSASAGVKCGIWLDFLGLADKHLDIPEIPVIPSIPLWHTPGSMDLVYDNDFLKTVVGETKEVEVSVSDFTYLPAPLMFIEWEAGAGGSWKYPVTITGVLGKTKNTWTPTIAGEHAPYCIVKNGSLVEIGRETFNTTTTKATK